MNRLFLLLCSCLCLLACTESGEDTYPAPEIFFIKGPGYTASDTALRLNESVLIGIESVSRSDVGLTLFHTCIDMDGEITRIDSGMNSPALTISRTLTKGTAENEIWSFYTRDRDGRQSDTISLGLKMIPGSEYSPILRYDTILMGAQDHPHFGKMLSLPEAGLYSFEEASGSQEKIWLLYYYDNLGTDKHTIGSPGANIDPSIYNLEGWSVKNTCRFLPIESIPAEVFLSAANDSLILEHSFEYAVGKRKAKKLGSGDVYSFVTETNKRGMIRILDVEGTESGSVKFQMILQEW